MTGRKGRIICQENGEIQYVPRHVGDVSLENLNVKERERFMSGEKVGLTGVNRRCAPWATSDLPCSCLSGLFLFYFWSARPSDQFINFENLTFSFISVNHFSGHKQKFRVYLVQGWATEKNLKKNVFPIFV